MSEPAAPDASFKAIGHDETPNFGRRRILAAGIPVEDRPAFSAMLAESGLGEVELHHAEKIDLFRPLEVLVGMVEEGPPPEMGRVPDGPLPRAVILSGLSDGETHRIIEGYRRLAWPPPLWAALTPTSASWPLGKLLVELSRERAALSRPPRAGRGETGS